MGQLEQELVRLVAIYGYLAIFLIVGIESMGIPMPGETVLIAAAIYAGHTHRLQIVGVIAAAAAGAVLGDNVGYGLGYWGGYRILRRWGRYVRVDHRRLKLGQYLFRRHGGKVVFFGRFVSVLRVYAAFLAGTNRMPWRRFLFFNAAGGIAWASLFGTGAYVLGGQVQYLSKSITIPLAVLAVLAVVAFTLYLRRHEARLQAEADRVLPGEI
jgi:membrane protein DedA with SNARE-associated domain